MENPNVEVRGSRNAKRGGNQKAPAFWLSLSTAELGTDGQRASTWISLKLDLSIANTVNEFVHVCIARLAALVVLQIF